MRMFLAMAVLMVPALCSAAQPTSGPQEALLSWEAPKLYTNGVAIPANLTIAYYVYRSNTDAYCGSTKLGPFGGTSVLLTSQPLGKRCYCLTAVVEGVESAQTPPACKTMRLPAPTEGAIEAPTDGSIER